MPGIDEYGSFDDTQRGRYTHASHYGSPKEPGRRNLDHQQKHDTQPSQQNRQASLLILNKSLSDDSSSLTTIDDSLTTLDGLNIDLPFSPFGYTHRSRSIKFKQVRFIHTYNVNCRPSATTCRRAPTTVRKLDLHEKIALYERRPDLAPFYYACGLLHPVPQTSAATNAASFNIEELVLAPLDEAGEILQIGRTWKPRNACTGTPIVAADETIASVGSTDAVANFDYRDDIPYDEEAVRKQNDGAHRRVGTLSLLDVPSGSDSVDGDDVDKAKNTCIRDDECPGGDMTRICRIYGPRAVDSILGCIANKQPS